MMKERFEQYEGDYVTITPDDDDCVSSIKEELKRLTLAERTIYLMWLNLGTYSAVAKVLKCSVPTISKKCRAISEKIHKKTEKICQEL